jgi:hypothetical protein
VSLCVLCVRFRCDHTQSDSRATRRSPRSDSQRRRIDRSRSAIDRDQKTSGPDRPEPVLPLPGPVRSNPRPAGPMCPRHLHLRRSLHGRSPRASVVVLYRRAKKEISCTQPRRRFGKGGSQDCQGPPAKITARFISPRPEAALAWPGTFTGTKGRVSDKFEPYQQASPLQLNKTMAVPDGEASSPFQETPSHRPRC